MFRRLKAYQVSIDVGLAVVFFLLGYSVAASRAADGVLVLILAVALGFRRFSPALALALTWIAAIFQMYVVHLSPNWPDFAIVAILYATAVYGIRVIRWLGFASIFAGALLGAAYLGFSGRPFAVGLHLDPANFASLARTVLQAGFFFALLLVLLGLPWTAGNLVRTRILARASRDAQVQAEQDAANAEAGVIVEQERNRIARDMHDVVAHSLAVVIAQADGARYARATDPSAVDEALSAISRTAREALGDVRLLLGQLRHSQSEGPQPALADLDRLLDQLRASGLTIGFEAVGTPLILGTGAQLAVYRIVQEGLTNVLRHGDVSHEATVQFEWTTTDLEVTISSMIIASPKTAELRLGHGLAGMRERAVLAGGHLSTEVDDRRFVVRATIPGTSAAQS
jgi:signal transduction histidine kinase